MKGKTNTLDPMGRVGDLYFAGTLSSFKNASISAIADQMFRNYSSLTSAVLPNVRNIGAYAFARTAIAAADFPAAVTVGSYAFESCARLLTANFPECTAIGEWAFLYCGIQTAAFPKCVEVKNGAFYGCKLKAVSFPACVSIGDVAFANVFALSSVYFPAAAGIGGSAFRACIQLKTASFPACTTIGSNAFLDCERLISLYLMGSSVAALGLSAFASTPIGGYSEAAGRYGSVFVPASLVSAYKKAKNWTSVAARITGV